MKFVLNHPPSSGSGTRGLIRSGILLTFAVIVLAAAAVLQLRRGARDDAETQTRQLAVVLAEHTARAFQAVDMVLLDIISDIKDTGGGGAGVTNAADLRAALGTFEAHQALQRRLENLPQVESFTIIGADGQPVTGSRLWPLRPTSFADRSFFRHFSTTNDPEPYVSEPVINRVNGGWTVYFARRISNSDGTFLGAVTAGIRLAYFDEFFAAVRFASGTGVTLARRNGEILKRFPSGPLEPGVALNAPDWYRVLAAGGGQYWSAGQARGGPRLVQVRPIPGYGLVVNVTRLNSAIFSGWWRQVMAIGAAAVCALIGTGVLGRILRRQVGTIEASHARLAEQAEALHASERRLTRQSIVLQTTLAHMNQGLIMVDADGTVLVSNQKAAELLDLPMALLNARPRFAELAELQRQRGEFQHLPEPERDMVDRSSVPASKQVYERRRPDGRMLEVCSMPLPGGGMVRTYTDITARADAEGMLAIAASRDQLTGLANRNAFGQRLDSALAAAQRIAGRFAVLCLDLDGFKRVNDTRGHEVGDRLLQRVAERLRETLRENDLSARLGGDEFAIVLSGADGEAAMLVAQRLLECIRLPYLIGDASVCIGVSFGIAIYPQDGGTAEQLLRNADSALYQAKAAGRNVWRVHSSDAAQRERHLDALEKDMRVALERRAFSLAYQPICTTATNVTTGFEALLRWDHPERGWISPAEFVPVAEQTGLIQPLGRWMLREACEEAARWPAPVQVAVKLSAAQFDEPDLLDFLLAVLNETGLSGSRLELELTGALLLDSSEPVVSTMQALRERGIRLVLGDAGVASSSLGDLRDLRFDAVKIDRSFLRALNSDRQAGRQVERLLAMAHAMGLEVLADGVETPEQLAMLRHLCCDRVQGLLLGGPAPGEAVRERMASLAVEPLAGYQ